MNNFYKTAGKRCFDLALTLPGFVLISPLLALIALLLRLRMGRPVIFKQLRPGLNGKPFTIYKFRTMIDARDQSGNLLPDAQRLTKLGKFLRATSLDELPELWNVIKGDMSLVGPRPLYMVYLDYYKDEENMRHSVKPGITGLAQVKGRNELPWDTRLTFDVEYVRKQSFTLDLRILTFTMASVIKCDNVVPVPGSRYLPLHIERKERRK